MDRIVTPVVLLLLTLAVAGCETMQGAGRDMQTAGQMLTQQSAESQAQMAVPAYGTTPAPAAAASAF
jgi:predicted small secreted protein